MYSSYFHDRSKLQKFPSRYFSHKNPSNFGILFEFFVLLTGTKKQPKNHRRKNGFVNSAPYGWCHCHLAARNVEMIGSSGFLVLGGLGWPSKIEVIKGFQVNIYILYIETNIIYIWYVYWYEIDIRYWILQSCCRVEWKIKPSETGVCVYIYMCIYVYV